MKDPGQKTCVQGSSPCRFIPVDDVAEFWQPETPHPIDLALGKVRCPCCKRRTYPVRYRVKHPGELERFDPHCSPCFSAHVGEERARAGRDGEDDHPEDTHPHEAMIAKPRQQTLRGIAV